MWRCVILVLTDDSEERIASIFRVEKSTSEEPVLPGGCILQYVHPKCRLTPGLYSTTSQKTTFFIIVAVTVCTKANKVENFDIRYL
jgi:hypothetical protein